MGDSVPPLAEADAPSDGCHVVRGLHVVVQGSDFRAEVTRHGVVAMNALREEVAVMVGRAVGIMETACSIADERELLASVVADRVVEALRVAEQREDSLASPDEHLGSRTPLTETAILSEIALVERVARRLRRFVRGLTNKTITVAPEAKPPAMHIDDVTRAKARRALARSGFITVKR